MGKVTSEAAVFCAFSGSDGMIAVADDGTAKGGEFSLSQPLTSNTHDKKRKMARLAVGLFGVAQDCSWFQGIIFALTIFLWQQISRDEPGWKDGIGSIYK